MEVAGKRETREAARNGATAVGEADSGLKPAEDMHGAPLPISHPKFGASPQVAPEYLSRRGVDWFKRGLGQDQRLGRRAFVNGGFNPRSGRPRALRGRARGPLWSEAFPSGEALTPCELG